MTITHLAVYRNETISVCFLQKKSKDKNVKENDNQEEMKESKAVNVTKHKIKEDQNLVYHIYGTERETTVQKCENRINFTCQYDSKKDNEICTCKNVITLRKHHFMRQYSGMPKQIYAYHGSRSFTDVGVGSIKTLPRKKVKRVYLPETDDIGVGSSELSSYMFRRSRYPKIVAVKNSFYDHKKTSSKCVGGILEYNTGCVINEKLSPIIQTKSGATSPKTSLESKNNEIGSNTVEKKFETIGTQFETENKEEKQDVYAKTVEVSAVRIKPVKKVSEQTQKFKNSNEGFVDNNNTKQEIEPRAKDADKTYSSDSLVQHVHNLESPSDEKHSRASFQDPMENKLEREYRKMFSTTKSKDSKSSYERPIPAFKSTSILRRRFEALRRGLAKKNESNSKKNDSVIVKTSTHESFPFRKDVSITSDPPSLIARSISNSKKYSPAVHNVEEDKNKTYINEHYGTQWPHTSTESECQGVKGMFKLWGKKFNFEDDMNSKNHAPPISSNDTTKKSEKEVKTAKGESTTKKEGKKFFFFKKKSKDRNKNAYIPKKNVTAGRCEIRDGLTLILGGTASPKEKISNISEEGEEITRKAWLRKFLTNTIESAKSVNIRWNNSMYATSSSTVFELLETVYKNNADIFRSRSEITTEDSSIYKSYTKHKVNFVQDIEAWMIPKTIPDRLTKQIPIKINSNKEIKDRNIEVTISDQKWYIDKSEAFSRKIEVVLHSKNFSKPNNNKTSSEYVRIDIPHDFFDPSSDESKRNQSSDEEVFKIVEYETNSEFIRDTNAIKDLEKGDHISKDIKVIVSVQESNSFEPQIIEKNIKDPPMQRDVVVQGSNVNIPKRCDVISVGIITQRDLREMINPSLKIQDDITDDESDEVLQPIEKKCEFANSYLQEYYRQWSTLGLDLCSSPVSDFILKSCSDKSVTSLHNHENSSKSCPNINDDFKEEFLSLSSYSHCGYEDQCVIKENCFSAKLFKRLKKNPSKAKTGPDTDKRILPKDSLEVFKRRKMYAASGKSQWANSGSGGEDRPVSIPSIESKSAQNSTVVACPRDKSILRSKKKTCKKHVSLPDCETMNSLLNKQLAETKPEGILQFKGAATGCEACKKKGSKCSKHAVVCPQPSCEIPQPPCKTSCEMLKNPPCSRPYSPSCNITPRSTTSGGTPVCPKPPLPPSYSPHQTQRCYPPQAPCSPSPCPASLTPCSRSRNKLSSTPTERSCSPCGDSICSRPGSHQPNTNILRPPCSKHRLPATCSKHSIPKRSNSPSRCSPTCIKSSSSPCEKPSPPPCEKLSPMPCIKPSPPPCKRKPSPTPCKIPSPPPFKGKPSPSPCANISTLPWKRSKSPNSSPRRTKKSRSPCKQPSPSCRAKPSPPPCTKPSPPPCFKPSSPPCSQPPTPPCKKPSPPACLKPSPPPCPCTTPSSPPCTRPSPCKIPTPPPVTRCLLPRPCPVKNHAPCPGKTCPNTPPPCKKSHSRRPPCKKLLKPAPCTTNPSECCHDYSSCEISCRSKPVSCKASQRSVCSTQSLTKKPSPLRKKCSAENIPDDSISCSSQISLPDNSPCASRKNCNQYSPPCAQKKSSTSPKNIQAGPGSKTGLLLRKCPTPPIKKPPKRSPCNLPPCDQLMKQPKSPRESRTQCQQKPSEEFPWPMDSNTSCPPSPNRGNSSTCPAAQQRNRSPECKKTCSMKHVLPKEKDCRPDCANQKKFKETGSNQSCNEETSFLEPQSYPPPAYLQGPQCPSKPIYLPCPIGTNSKVSGIYLKMRPSRKKTCAEDCTAWEYNEELQGIVKLSSHDENITIRLKQQIPSTEELRECGEPKNIRVQGEDGKTLYERKDYNYSQQQQHHPSVLGDMYRDSNINRVSAPIAVTNVVGNNEKELSPCKSDRSLSNSIEIQFKLRIIQGDKTTEINIGNENGGKNDQKYHIAKASPEVFVVKSGTDKITEDADPKNDINIKIIVRNFRPKHKDGDGNQRNDDFAKNISDKFHTVSTGYSDVDVEPNKDNVVSIHRTTVDLYSSAEGSKTQVKISNKVPSKEFAKNEENLTASSHSTEQVPTYVTEDEYNDIKSTSSIKDSEKIEETNTNESELPDFNDTDDQDATLLDNNTSDECNVNSAASKHTSKELKKGLLKKIFYKAGKTEGKDKKTVRQLRDMLKIILTDSSDNDAKNVTSNEIEKDVKFAPIRTYLRDTDSMNNYYQLENNLSSLRNTKIAAIYPSKEQHSVTSKSSISDTSDAPFRGCICSQVAEKLNKSNMNVRCCCRPKIRKDEETNCDLRNAEDLFLLNFRTEYVDVETQHSKYLSSKVNSLNVSIHSKNTSFIKTTKETTVVEQFEIINRPLTKKRVTETFSPHKSYNGGNEIKIMKSPSEVSNKNNRKKDGNKYKEVDILQSYEAKKAVLEIYAEKAENGEHYVAKLPKFVYEKESEITRNYEQIATNSYKSVCKQNIVMSMQR